MRLRFGISALRAVINFTYLLTYLLNLFACLGRLSQIPFIARMVAFLHATNVSVTNSILNFALIVICFVTVALLQRGKLASPSVTQRGEADGASINTPVVNDRSPLIKNATSPPPIIADATAFDNAAAAVAEPLQETTSASGGVTSNVDRKLSDSPPEVERNVVGKDAASTPRSASSKKRKVLSIVRLRLSALLD